MADYPAYRYSSQGTRLVNNAEEDKALGEGWFNNPKLEPPVKDKKLEPIPELPKAETKPVHHAPTHDAKGKGK